MLKFKCLTSILFAISLSCNAAVFAAGTAEAGTRTEYTDNFEGNDISNWVKKSGSGTISAENGALHIKGDLMLIDTAGPLLDDGLVEIEFDQLNDRCGIGLVFRASDSGHQAIYNSDPAVHLYYLSKWNFTNDSGTDKTIHTDGTPMVRRAGISYKMKVRFCGDVITMWIDNQCFFTKRIPQAVRQSGRIGIITTKNSEILVKKITCSDMTPLKKSNLEPKEITISRGSFKVMLDKNFPRVRKYQLAGRELQGDPIPYYYVTINSEDYPARAVIIEQAADRVRYRVSVDGTDVSFDIICAISDTGVLDMRIQNISEASGTIYTIGFPKQMLISAGSSEKNASIAASAGGRDTFINLAGKSAAKDIDTFCSIPIVTNGQLAASMTSNVIDNLCEFRYRSIDLPAGSTATGFGSNDFMYRGIDGKRMFEKDDLYCRIAVTADTNDDKIIDWQDGANALKPLIEDRIYGSASVRNSFIHIGYNFAGVVQQPFLKAADNLKRLSNCIDGFGQIFILKGYASEGHDSGHADYENINMRAGGAEDLKVLTDEAAKINAIFGIHINHSEAYPEARMFTDKVMTDLNAWAWLDQAKYIRRHTDICNGGMDRRLDEMFAKAAGIGFVYLDTYRDGRWSAAKIAASLIDRHNAIFGTEDGSKLDRWVAWVHHCVIGDGIHRFIYHRHKDIYKRSPLFRGGYNRSASFTSWQGGRNIDTMVRQFYTEQLPQKYLMHHDIRRISGSEAMLSDGVTVTNENGVNRIYKDGHLIAAGATVFIPWFAPTSETRNPDEADRIYHWNPANSKTTWHLPANWQDQKQVQLYQTSQTGKKLVATIPIIDNTITIDAKANTPYVVYKGDANIATVETKWSVGSPIEDTGFNSRDFSIWNKSSSAKSTDHIKIIDDTNAIALLTIEGADDGQVYQTMRNLVPGRKYRASVFAGAENGKTASITVTTADGKNHSNYTDNTAIACNLIHHDANGKKVQRIWVDFIMPEGRNTTAKLTLSAAASKDTGKVQFMECRIVKTDAPQLPEGCLAWEDFEHVDQAFGIFIPEKTESHSHLSEYHAGYTDDTINGNWSLKMRTNFRTTPSTLRLAANTDYSLRFKTPGSGRIVIASESTGETLLEKPFKAGSTELTFTTADRKDYVIRILGGRVLDDFGVYLSGANTR